MAATVRGACPLDCPDTCAWQLTVEDGRAVDLRGDRAHPFTRGASSAARKATLGGHVGFDPEDLVHARLVVLWGANLLSSNVHQWRFVLAARGAGAPAV